MRRFVLFLVLVMMTGAAMAQGRHEQRVAGPAGHGQQRVMPGGLSRTGGAGPVRPMVKAAPEVASPEEVEMMVRRVKDEGFDDRRVETAKLMVTMKMVPAEGIARMASAMSFDDNRLEFLKFAYEYCADRENYFVAMDALTFSSNRDKLREYIMRENEHMGRGGKMMPRPKGAGHGRPAPGHRR